MACILFDDAQRDRFFPFTRTRAIADIRCGILTARERWEQLLNQETGTLTETYLQPLFTDEAEGENTYINASFLATKALKSEIELLKPGEKLVHGETVIAAKCTPFAWDDQKAHFESLKTVEMQTPAERLEKVWDIFSKNGAWLRQDFELLTAGRKCESVPEGVAVSGKQQLFIEKGAKIGVGTIINATAGPVYVGKGAEIMEGSIVRGPFALCSGAVLKMGTKAYGDTTIGPGCKVGGEVTNAVFFANSNKGHDGFVGNCVIGEWCNLGADTNASNLKNNYDGVKIHDDATGRRLATGLTFCGLLMADHSKCGINTMFNTGTVIGVSCNVYGGEFPPSYIPSFSWGGAAGFKTYTLEKALETANRMMDRRGKKLSDAEVSVMKHIFEQTASQRETEHKKITQ